MDWNIWGFIGYFFGWLLLAIAVCTVAMLVASLILRVVYGKMYSEDDGSGKEPRHNNAKLLIAVMLVIGFGLLLKFILDTYSK